MTHLTRPVFITPRRRPFYRALFVLLMSGPALHAGYKDDIGWTKLQAELGGSLPTGAGVGVSQIEALESATTPPYSYAPDTASTEFTGKTFSLKRTPSATSGHATTVGGYFYGLTGSVAPGVTTVDVNDVNNWLGSSFLRFGSVSAPAVEVQKIQNHSWVGAIDNGGPNDIEVLRRFDYAIQTSEFLGFVGLNNGNPGNLPALLAGCYNGMSVGMTNGIHSYGTNTADGAGRTKPEIVAPQTATSWATATVSSTAALLRQSTPNANSRKVVSLKAILLAGATKSQFPGWSRTTTRPIDSVFGAGQVNAYRSYRILTTTEQAPSNSVLVTRRGWDFNTTAAAGSTYFFDLPAGDTVPDLSVMLTWNRTIAGVWPTATTSNLANLTLKLYAASGFTKGALIDSSESAVDNIEHIYKPSLAAGRYAIEVTSNQVGVEYGLAWYSQPTVTIAATAPAAAETGLAAGTFTLTRAGDTATALTVAYAISGSATAGADYQALSGTATFSAGSATTTVAVTPKSDTVAEGDETVTLTITPDINYSVGTASAATVIIADLPIDAWRFSKFTATELADSNLSGDEADFDSDGIRHLTEYALGLEPKTPGTSGLPTASIQAGGALALTYTHVKSATDVNMIVQVTNDLGSWNSGPAFTSVLETTDNGATETIKVGSLLAPGAGQKQFMRLRITRPAP